MSADSATTCRRFRVTGRVQGVFFRDSTRQVAGTLTLTGHARNMPDGSVEVLACGHPDAVDKLAGWLNEGPPKASVSDVESEEVDQHCPPDFTVR